jgi:hypothetical protein
VFAIFDFSVMTRSFQPAMAARKPVRVLSASSRRTTRIRNRPRRLLSTWWCSPEIDGERDRRCQETKAAGAARTHSDPNDLLARSKCNVERYRHNQPNRSLAVNAT